MRTFALPAAIAGTMLAAFFAAPAHAQATRTWVASGPAGGNDANPCSRTAPCKTFAGALPKTLAGGMINCVDPDGYGSVTLTVSMTIDCTGTYGSILATSGTNGVTVSGSGIVVILRSLTISGAGSGAVGVNFQNGAELHIENSTITRFGGNLNFTVPTGVTAKLNVRNTSISDAGGASINIFPSGTGVVRATFDGVQADNNAAGFYVLAGSGGSTHVTIKNSSMSGNGFYGMAIDGSGGPAQVLISNSVMSNNGTFGVLSSGANATVFVCCSTASGNDTGLSASGGGGLGTYQNNNINMNTTANIVGSFPAMQQ